MIQSFRHKGLQLFYEKDDRSRLSPHMVDRIQEILTLLDAARTIQDMNLPSLRLHPLKGKLKGHWSVTVRANWRITFRFENADAFDVDLVDYH